MVFADIDQDVHVSKRTKEKKNDCINTVSVKRTTSKLHLHSETSNFQSKEILDITEYEVC